MYAIALDESNRGECPHSHGTLDVLVSGGRAKCEACGRAFLVQDIVTGSKRYAIVTVKPWRKPGVGGLYTGDWL